MMQRRPSSKAEKPAIHFSKPVDLTRFPGLPTLSNMARKEDIYHKDQPPPLAKGRSRRGSSGRSYAPPPKERLPFDGKHIDGPMPRRRRRSRRKSSAENRKSLWVAVGLLAALVVYFGIWTGLKFASRSRQEPPQAVEAGMEAPKTPPPAELPDVRVDELIQSASGIERMINGALELNDRNQHAQALERLLKAADQLPRHSDILFTLAETHFAMEHYTQSAVTAFQLLEQDPDRLPARILLARALHRLNRHQDAADMAKWALQTDNYLLEAHTLAAAAYRALGDIGEAIPHLRNAYNLRPDNHVIANDLADAYTEVGNFDRALNIFNDLMRQKDVDSVTFFNLAICYAQTGRTEKVIETLYEAGRRFGTEYVHTWISNRQFDAIREEPSFQEFVTEFHPAS